MAQCPSCQADLPNASRFCNACGSSVAPSTSTPTELAPGDLATPAQQTPTGGSRSPSSSGIPDVRFPPGTIVGERFRIVGLLGKGGMGEVYRADDLTLGQAVALKFLPTEMAADPGRLERFLGEVRVARQVAHPNVCRVYDIGVLEGQHFISMELIDGDDLTMLLRQVGRFPEDKALEIARQLCAGLAAAHDRGVIHRDLKPANVMIDGRGRVRITDFGLASMIGTVAGMEILAGTPAYMAPEQLAGEEVTVKSDLYALGLVLYELFTGKAAHRAATMTELRKLHESTPTHPSSHVPDLDPGVEQVILHCLEKDPRSRPATALAVAAALPGGDPLAAALAAGETPSPEMVAEAGGSEAMHPGLALGAAVLVVAAFALGARLDGRNQVRAYVPLEKPPIAMVDRAREVIAELGYIEPLYSDPYDAAFGYSIWDHQIAWVEEHDDSSDRWQQLGKPQPGVVGFWYRQSPGLLYPSAGWGAFSSGRVERWNPFPATPGEILVSLDVLGRLEFFVYTPRRYSEEPIPEEAPDWSTVFALAGLDMADFTPIEPRYQRFMAPEQRAAWVGRLPDAPEAEVRIAAGMSEGRVVLFGILWPWELQGVGSEPTRSTGPGVGSLVFLGVFLPLLAGSALIARRNIKGGRADRRGGARITAFMFVATFAREALRSHVLLSLGGMSQIIPILGTAVFYAAVVLVMYLALEPYARRIWPTMLVSWSRLLSSSGRRWLDPLVGRSVLAGLAVGVAIFLISDPIQHLVLSALDDAPLRPETGHWNILLGTRQVVADLADTAIGGVFAACIMAFTLILARLILRRQTLAIGAAMLVFVALEGFNQTALPGILVEIGFAILITALSVALLLRFGLLALVVALALSQLGDLAATPSWSAWHGQPAILVTVVVAVLAAYSFWAASAGRSLIREEAV